MALLAKEGESKHRQRRCIFFYQSEILPGRVGFSSCSHIPRVPGADSDLGGELAKVGRAVGWVETSTDYQGVSLDLSPGAPCLWEGSWYPRTRDQGASATKRLYQPLQLPSPCPQQHLAHPFYLSLPQDVDCVLYFCL